MSVINNTSKPELVLNKMNKAIYYHTVQEFVAIGESLIVHINWNKNPADLLTKDSFGGKRRYLVDKILHEVYGGGIKSCTVAK